MVVIDDDRRGLLQDRELEDVARGDDRVVHRPNEDQALTKDLMPAVQKRGAKTLLAVMAPRGDELLAELIQLECAARRTPASASQFKRGGDAGGLGQADAADARELRDILAGQVVDAVAQQLPSHLHGVGAARSRSEENCEQVGIR